jgi:hypothetical protein
VQATPTPMAPNQAQVNKMIFQPASLESPSPSVHMEEDTFTRGFHDSAKQDLLQIQLATVQNTNHLLPDDVTPGLSMHQRDYNKVIEEVENEALASIAGLPIIWKQHTSAVNNVMNGLQRESERVKHEITLVRSDTMKALSHYRDMKMHDFVVQQV